MIAGLYGTRASGAVGLFQRLDVLFIEVAPRVHSVEMNEPAKEVRRRRARWRHTDQREGVPARGMLRAGSPECRRRCSR